ncbi:polysaccharide deacetylase [Alicyclobacillus hesperidum URH17-3-68]|nr:polysaccharide deacetylase [Alicyclobacillus hesperidum URH17-3-68]
MTTNWQATAMANTTITADFRQTLDIQRDFTTEIALNLMGALNLVTQTYDFFFREVLHSTVRINASRRQNLISGRPADAKNIGQSDFDALVARQIDTGNTCHVKTPPPRVSCKFTAKGQAPGTLYENTKTVPLHHQQKCGKRTSGRIHKETAALPS